MTEWIDVQDRLPRIGRRVLVTGVYDDGRTAVFGCHRERTTRNWLTFSNITAWHPLPKPYRQKKARKE